MLARYARVAQAGLRAEILVNQRLNAAIEDAISTEALPEQFKGFSRPVQAFRVA